MFRVLSFTKHRNAQQIPSLSIVKLTKPCNAQKESTVPSVADFRPPPTNRCENFGSLGCFFLDLLRIAVS